MKALISLILFGALSSPSMAGNPYRDYLFSKVFGPVKQVEYHAVSNTSSLSAAAYIPRFERPKGAVFCRMEDKVTKVTGVWLKIGVE